MSDYGEIERWSDEQILRAASGGDETAFAFFCERSLPSLYRYLQGQCRRRKVPVDLAEGFCHDAIIRAVKKIRAIQAGSDSPPPEVSYAWLAQIAFNVLRDWKKKNSRMKNVDGQIEIESPPQLTLEEIEEQEEVVKFFQWLDNRERDILEYVLLSEMTIVDAGVRLGLSRSNSYRVYHKALTTLQGLIEEHGRQKAQSRQRF